MKMEWFLRLWCHQKIRGRSHLPFVSTRWYNNNMKINFSIRRVSFESRKNFSHGVRQWRTLLIVFIGMFLLLLTSHVYFFAHTSREALFNAELNLPENPEHRRYRLRLEEAVKDLSDREILFRDVATNGVSIIDPSR